MECTSRINPPLQHTHRCLTSSGKLPQYKTFPQASAFLINCYVLFSLFLPPSLSLSLRLSFTLTKADSQRSKPNLLRSPSPQLLVGDVHFSLGAHKTSLYAWDARAAPWVSPKGNSRGPLLHTALSVHLSAFTCEAVYFSYLHTANAPCGHASTIKEIYKCIIYKVYVIVFFILLFMFGYN